MPTACFLDTNVPFYAASARNDDPRKYHLATRLLDSEGACLSAQVLQEFYVNIIRKPAIPLTPAQAMEWVDRLARFPCTQIDAPLVNHALALSQRYRISYWDAAILAAAERLEAEVVYTEDLNHGQTYGAVRVVNPFLPA